MVEYIPLKKISLGDKKKYHVFLSFQGNDARQKLMVHESINNTRRDLGYLSCGTRNPIHDCWRCDANWQCNRKQLADCAIGFGRNAIGGKNGHFYVVTDPSD